MKEKIKISAEIETKKAIAKINKMKDCSLRR